MATRWVGKAPPAGGRGGTPPADAELQKLYQELATLIGADNIHQAAWRRGGSGTAGEWLGAFEISETGWEILTTGIAGPQGFELLR